MDLDLVHMLVYHGNSLYCATKAVCDDETLIR